MKYKRLILVLFITGLLIIPYCEPDKKMLVETGEASNISITSADVSGKIIDVGEGATQHGHCYGTSSDPTTSGSKTTLGVAANGGFTSSLTGLEPSTKYYVRAYTSLGEQVAYGTAISFSTSSAALPEVTTSTITSITKTSAVSGGNITSEGGTSVTARGICWNVASGPTVALTTKTTDGEGSGSFASSITGLSANTVYYVRAYATNAGGTAYGNEISFTTSPEVAVAPTVITAEVTSVTSNSAVCGGNVTNEGGAPVTAKGVCWSTTANPTITSSKTADGTGSGSFVSNLTNLNPGATYYVRSYATNSAGTSYGNELSFTTNALVPTLTTIAITSITTTSAVSGGDITSNGGASITVRGVCWSTSQNPTTDDSHTSDGTGSGTYSSNLLGLTGNTTYYVRAYATNSAGTAYGNERSFKTGTLAPALTTAEVTSVTSTTASSGGNITTDGGSAVTARGVCWSTSANPTTTDAKTTDGTGTGSFTSSITGLTPGTTYHVRAYAINSAGTGYGEDLSFTTGAVVPTVTTTAISAITSTTASSGGNVTSDGGASVTARGVCWSTAANPTTADSKTSDGTGTGPFISSITGLTPGGNYHVRAYATNSIGTVYGEDLTFTAGAVLATVTTAGISDITSTTASSGGNVTSDGGSAVTAKGVCWSSTANPTIANSKTNNGSGTGPFTSSITGLIPGNTYHVRAYATNSAGTAYGEDLTFMTGAVVPTVTSTAISAITSTTASSGGNVTSDGGAAVTAKGICWSTTANPTIVDSKTNNGTGSGSFISSLEGLAPCMTYHVRAYATNSAGTAYGEDLAFTTNTVLPTVSTVTISNITSYSASSGGEVSGNCASVVTARGICWSTNPNPTTANYYTVDGSGSGSFPSSLTGLLPGKTYYVRAYATNSAGTSYAGNELSFSTPALVPTLTTIAVTSITNSSASSGGDITSDGGANVTVRGVCWNTSPGPTTANSKTTDGIGTGVYTSNLTSLTTATTYWIRAYATNSTGTAYGNELMFTSAGPPTVTTLNASLIENTSATLNGKVIANGASTIVSFEYKEYAATDYISVPASPSPVTGTNEISITANLSGLKSGAGYNFKIKAVNAYGTVEGTLLNFVTAVKDPDGNVYTTILIGSYLWMKENLKTTKYQNGTPIPKGLTGVFPDDPGYGWYNNDSVSYKDTYGALYRWGSVKNNNICPLGWRVASTEWNTLITAIGGQTQMGTLKEMGTSHWISPNTGASNSYNFTALPGGIYFFNYDGLGYLGSWWAKMVDALEYPITATISYDSVNGSLSGCNCKESARSVRCVRDK